MQAHDKFFKEAKEILKHVSSFEFDDVQVKMVLEFCIKLAQTTVKLSDIHIEREHRLKREGDGFELESDGYSCMVCNSPMTVNESWYSRFGQTCRKCYKALNDSVLPSFVSKYPNSYYGIGQLKSNFKINAGKAKSLIRDGKLHARIILNEDGTPYKYIFLKKENPTLVTYHSPVEKSTKRYKERENKKLIAEMLKKIDHKK